MCFLYRNVSHKKLIVWKIDVKLQITARILLRLLSARANTNIEGTKEKRAKPNCYEFDTAIEFIIAQSRINNE